MIISIIAAVADNMVIGINNFLPWNLSRENAYEENMETEITITVVDIVTIKLFIK